MLQAETLYYSSAAAIFGMMLINILTWRSNKSFSGTGLFAFYPVLLLATMLLLGTKNYLPAPLFLPLAYTTFFAASVVHVLAIRQFFSYFGLAVSIFVIVSGCCFVGLLYFGVFDNSSMARQYLASLQHIIEAGFLTYLFLRIGLKHYPNGSMVYLIILCLNIGAFSVHILWLVYGDSGLRDITLLVNGVLTPMFYAAGLAILCNERREQNLNQLNAKAEKDLALRNLFLSTISHEIRTPLNGILGSTQLVMNQSLDPRNKPYCEAIINSVESLNLLIDKVLNYASLEQGSEPLYEEDIELKSWLDNLCLLLSPLAKQKQLNFSLDYNLPDDACYYFDHQKLRQILINLVGNAIKFTDQGSVVLRLDLLREGDDYHTIRFDVIDSGSGIAASEQALLTQPYVQSRSGKSKGGTGLGLSITSKLLERLDSQLNINSQLGHGSKFSFEIRLAIGEPSLIAPHEQASHIITGLNVLLIEDLDLNQKIAIEFMAIDDHHVTLTSYGNDALVLMQKQKFDVILLDINLPDISGQDVLKQLKHLKHKNTDTPILVFTASLSPDEVKAYLNLGIKGIVGKPIKQEKLRQALYDSQSSTPVSFSAQINDVLFDSNATGFIAKALSSEGFTSVYHDFITTAEAQLAQCKSLQKQDKTLCIRLLHDQANTALQLGFNRYGLLVKDMERSLLTDKRIDTLLKEANKTWQVSLQAYQEYLASRRTKR